MAHANPEFALGLMRNTPGPVSAERRDVPTGRDLRQRMDAILSLPPARRSQRDAMLAQDFIEGAARCRPQARMHCSFEQLALPADAERPKRGERFVEPRQRVPLDVQKNKVPGSW